MCVCLCVCVLQLGQVVAEGWVCQLSIKLHLLCRSYLGLANSLSLFRVCVRVCVRVFCVCVCVWGGGGGGGVTTECLPG